MQIHLGVGLWQVALYGSLVGIGGSILLLPLAVALLRGCPCHNPLHIALKTVGAGAAASACTWYVLVIAYLLLPWRIRDPLFESTAALLFAGAAPVMAACLTATCVGRAYVRRSSRGGR